ncbi:MAG: hypothetical protein HY877_01790 [Deltaproteobacteria bacterium]|nr:hypothetical protein [Deltaproteobacteria bacterium]
MKRILFLFGMILIISSAVLAGPDCPESKPPPQDVMTTVPSESAPSPSPPSVTVPAEPSSTKEQMGLTFDPAIPDKSGFEEEKNPERKKLLDKLFEAKKNEVDAKIRLDELERLKKDNEEQYRKIVDADNKLFKEWHDVVKKKEQLSIFRSTEPLDRETDRIIRELHGNWESRDGLYKQMEAFHKETLKMLGKQADYGNKRISLEWDLQQTDTKQGAEKVSIPKLGR